MATTRKVLGQVAPTAATDTTLYTAPAATSTVASSIVVCNQNITTQAFRVAVRPGGASMASQHYVFYDVSVPPNDTFIATIGVTLAATDVVTVRADATGLSFSLFGEEAT